LLIFYTTANLHFYAFLYTLKNLSLLNPIVKVLKEKFDDAKEISQKPSIEGKTIQWPKEKGPQKKNKKKLLTKH
jgi:hypothetical protein